MARKQDRGDVYFGEMRFEARDFAGGFARLCETEHFPDGTSEDFTEPGIVVGALAVEIAFKALVMRRDGFLSAEMQGSHGLLDLFRKLAPDDADFIRSFAELAKTRFSVSIALGPGVHVGDHGSFEANLGAIGKAFVEWRYAYEHEKLTIDVGFLDRVIQASQACLDRWPDDRL